MKNSLIVTALALSATLPLSLTTTAYTATDPAPSSCTTAREYIATLEYLRDRKEFAVPEAQARQVAARVAAHCTGAGNRFMRVSRTLSVAGLGGNDAIATGEEFSARTDREADTFLAVFRKAFSEDGLDLDIGAALKLARSLTTGFDGDVQKVRADYETLLGFCMNTDRLNLPRPRCGEYAAEIAREGNTWAVGVAPVYLRLYEFLTVSKDGPGLTAADALPLARATVKAGPDSAENFTQSYRYGISRKGLDLSRDQAVAFARDLAFKAGFTAPAPASQSTVEAAKDAAH